MGKLPKFFDPDLLVGTDTSDDAAVYKVSEELALIQTVDFFTPIADDPYTFGQIAAANALSDVYAMGGEPKIALNIAAFPGCLSVDILGEILAGGADKVLEAGAVLAGGHSIQDDEPKYGLCVTGFVNPQKMWRNDGAREGDVLILTKPLGSGIINTAVKAELASAEEEQEAVEVMRCLNKYACEAVKHLDVHGCTDITGFGLIGHAMEMAEGSNLTFYIHTGQIPVIRGALDYASMGLVPGGAYKNREYTQGRVFSEIPDMPMEDVLYDPQTSGGLLISIGKEDAEDAMKALEKMPFSCAVIGEVKKREDYLIRLQKETEL